MKVCLGWIRALPLRHHRKQSRASSSTFAEYLDRRSSFLESIGTSDAHLPSTEQQSKLMAILQNIGSTNSTNATSSEKYLSPHAGLGADAFGANEAAQTARDAVTIRQMLACSMHLGHATSRWNPKMAPYIFGERTGVHIINLERTLLCLRQACQVVIDVASKGGVILFVGTGDSIQRLTYECAQDCNQYYVNLRWIGGTITNRAQVLRSDKLAPDMLIVLDPVRNKKAILEACEGNIPVIAICDTDCDPTPITYPIPANDDAYSSVELVARLLSLAAAEGQQVRTRPLPSSDVFESAMSFIDRVFTHKR